MGAILVMHPDGRSRQGHLSSTVQVVEIICDRVQESVFAR